MNAKSWGVMMGTAGATMFLTLAVCWSFGAIADAPKPEAPTIVWPTLSATEYDITLRTAKPSYKADESPVVELDVVNRISGPVAMTINLKMMTMSVRSAMSRMGPMRTVAWEASREVKVDNLQTATISIPADKKIGEGPWEASREVKVDGHETATISIPTDRKVGEGREVYFTLEVNGKSISTPPFSTPMPTIQLTNSLKAEQRPAFVVTVTPKSAPAVVKSPAAVTPDKLGK